MNAVRLHRTDDDSLRNMASRIDKNLCEKFREFRLFGPFGGHCNVHLIHRSFFFSSKFGIHETNWKGSRYVK